jgi:hypothetical protein
MNIATCGNWRQQAVFGPSYAVASKLLGHLAKPFVLEIHAFVFDELDSADRFASFGYFPDALLFSGCCAFG